jgi:hypothetical protein
MFKFSSVKVTAKDPNFTNCIDYADTIAKSLLDSGYLEQDGYNLIHGWYVEHKDVIRKTTNPFVSKYCGITIGKRDGIEQFYPRAACLQNTNTRNSAGRGRFPSGQAGVPVKGGKRKVLAKKRKSKVATRKASLAARSKAKANPRETQRRARL